MCSQKILQYDSPHQFEPLMPSDFAMSALLEKASVLQRESGKLSSLLPVANAELKGLLRKMNSYYTNLIEGEHTRPSDIDRALAQDYSDNQDMARKQRLAIAHIKAEEKFEDVINDIAKHSGDPVSWLYSKNALKEIHYELFQNQNKADLTLIDGSLLTPGDFRDCGVAVGRHEAPAAKSLDAFLDRWTSFYAGVRKGEYALASTMAAHHRLAWIHPFKDGNGRVTRLHTHLLMHALGLSDGLWSPLRGFAKTQSQYKALLQAADEHRHGDLDGRGNLTQKGLINWMDYTLDTCIDQVQFMSSQLNIKNLFERIGAAIIFEESIAKSGIRKESIIPLKFLFSTQIELSRAEFKSMSGLGDRVATDNMSALLNNGYLLTDSAYGKVRFGIPQKALRFYFPALWTEAENDHSPVQMRSSIKKKTRNFEM